MGISLLEKDEDRPDILRITKKGMNWIDSIHRGGGCAGEKKGVGVQKQSREKVSAAFQDSARRRQIYSR